MHDGTILWNNLMKTICFSILWNDFMEKVLLSHTKVFNAMAHGAGMGAIWHHRRCLQRRGGDEIAPIPNERWQVAFCFVAKSVVN